MHDTSPPDKSDDETMSQNIETFAEECRNILQNGSDEANLDKVRRVVEKYLVDDDFISTHLGPNRKDGGTLNLG